MKTILRNPVLLFTVSGIICFAEEIVIYLVPVNGFDRFSSLFAFLLIVQGSIQSFYGICRMQEDPWQILLYFPGTFNLALGCFFLSDQPLTGFIFRIITGTAWASVGIAMLFFVYCLHRRKVQDSWLVLWGIFSLATGFFVILCLQNGAIPAFGATALYALVFAMIILLFGRRAGTRFRIYNSGHQFA